MKVLILGGYGVFGKRIAMALSREPDISLIIAGRSIKKAKAFADTIAAQASEVDIQHNLSDRLRVLDPMIIINCCGPFQGNDFTVLEQCIKYGYHYIDLADGRDYVSHFLQQDAQVKKSKILAFTGASTVPAISSAMLEYFTKSEFTEIHTLDYGVSPGNQTERGVATVAAILSYVGKPFTTLINRKPARVIGWQGLKRVTYPKIGKRWMSYCNIPDLDLFPQRYPTLKTIRFYAGLELSLLHLGLWLFSWLVRWKWIGSLQSCAKVFRHISLWFYPLGSNNGGMHMHLRGIDIQGSPKAIAWHLIAKQNDGPQIPATPAVILAKKIARGEIKKVGAYATLGMITKEELIAEWNDLNIHEVQHELPL